MVTQRKLPQKLGQKIVPDVVIASTLLVLNKLTTRPVRIGNIWFSEEKAACLIFPIFVYCVCPGVENIKHKTLCHRTTEGGLESMVTLMHRCRSHPYTGTAGVHPHSSSRIGRIWNQRI